MKKSIFSTKMLFVGSDGFEPPKLEAADLQSAPFGHSGNYPLVGVDGFEPPTLCL